MALINRKISDTKVPSPVTFLSDPAKIDTSRADMEGFVRAQVEHLAYISKTASKVDNTTTETAFAPEYEKTVDTLVTNTYIKLLVTGRYTRTGSPTVTLRIYAGSVVLLSQVVTLAADGGWSLEANIITDIDSDPGPWEAQGTLIIGDDVYNVFNTAVVNVDPDDINITVTAQWSAASGSNSITCRQFVVISRSPPGD